MLLRKKLLKKYDQTLDHSGVSGERLASRIAQLSDIGLTEDEGSNRMGFSDEEARAKQLVKQWMEEAGLTISEDGAGNVFGRLAGQNDALPAVLSGSHLDTVPNGGHFDGVLGVLSALEVAETWKETSYQPVRPFEVVIFTHEEGSRFNSGLHGSKAMVGDFQPDLEKSLTDIYGEPFEQVAESQGWSLDSFAQAKRDLSGIKTFVEVHIEQGKRLEKDNIPAGIVTGIAAPCFLEMTFRGSAGHAGNTPMNDRQDALACASEFIYRLPSLPEKVNDTAVATVGKLHAYPNGINVIPGEVTCYVDIRDIEEVTRDELVQRVIREAQETAMKHQIDFEYTETQRNTPVPIEDEIQRDLADAVSQNGIQPVYLASGAAHDAMIIGSHLPVAMLFVQSKDGVSHHPDEWSSLDDCIQGVHVLKSYIEQHTQS